MVKNAEQEVGSAKQEVGSYVANGASQSKTDENLGPLGYIYSTHMPNMAKNIYTAYLCPIRSKMPNRNFIFGFAKQEVGLYLGNGVSQSKTDENLGTRGYIYSIYMPNKTKKAKQEVGSTKQEKQEV